MSDDVLGPSERRRATFLTQANALTRKNWSFQKRRWGTNIFLLSAPFLISCLLYSLQEVINNQLSGREYRCGCKCLSCCDWVPVRAANGSTIYLHECYDATNERPCSPYASCSSYNDTECGYLYSSADQVGFCSVVQPPLWPALVQIPRSTTRGTKYPEIDPQGVPRVDALGAATSAPLLFSGGNETEAGLLMQNMWSRGASITDDAMAAYLRAQAAGMDLPSSTEGQAISSEADFVDAAGALTRGLYEFGLVMGTSSFTSVTMLMEPAFVATTGVAARPPLYFIQPNCSALSAADVDTLGRIGEAITNMTGFGVECISVPPARLPLSVMNDQVYCGWLSSGCVVRNETKQKVSASQSSGASNPIQEFIGALYDWSDTNSAAGRFNASVWVNNTNVARDPGVPDIQRWSQPVNLAANAYIKTVAGPAASARLAGVKDMPKGETRLSLDFSSLLGPLFMMWFMQLLLPVNVYTLVHEKEHHLRIMMRMQGLREGAYYAVQYVWMLLMYCLFMALFVAFGAAIGLKIFTLSSLSVQFVYYFLWGNLLAAFSFFFASWQREARPAVLASVVYVIVTGFVANIVLVQYIERGPTIVADILQIIPAFGLFRGLYELAQYAFLADRTGGKGITWATLLEPDCAMLQVWLYFVIEWMFCLIVAYYIEQVTGAGTGVKRHPLFFLRRRRDADNSVNTVETKNGLLKDDFKNDHLERDPSPPTCSPVARLQADTADVLSPLDYYYGAGANERPAGSPRLDADALNSAATHNKNAAPAYDHTHLVARAASSVVRKVTSIKLSLQQTSPVKELESGGNDPNEGTDIAAERQRVERLWQQWRANPSAAPPCAILLHQLRKVYPSRGGAAAKVAVQGLSLAIERRECFGLLGPNGAGKTTTIRMMEGFLDPSGGAAIVEGFSIPDDIDAIYTIMGACPQHDLLWSCLTGREHLLFYGRIKALHGAALKRAVDEGLRRVSLLEVGDKLVSAYSGGMKRRLSVAIALIGDPLVVYLDEPSTGLDPSSRRLLWDVIKEARRSTAIVLTTHSMEEAEILCDRLGIFVRGKLQCLGDPKSLTARFGGYLSFTITTQPHQERGAAALVRSMSPSARLVYALGGTQRFELPLAEVDAEAVFRRMEEAKLRGEVELLDWGVSHATLEEIFIKVTRDAGVQISAFTG